MVSHSPSALPPPSLTVSCPMLSPVLSQPHCLKMTLLRWPSPMLSPALCHLTHTISTPPSQDAALEMALTCTVSHPAPSPPSRTILSPQSRDGPLEVAHAHAVSCAMLSCALEVAFTHVHMPTVPCAPPQPHAIHQGCHPCHLVTKHIVCTII